MKKLWKNNNVCKKLRKCLKSWLSLQNNWIHETTRKSLQENKKVCFPEIPKISDKCMGLIQSQSQSDAEQIN